MQSLDWAFILGMSAAAAGLGHPLGSMGIIFHSEDQHMTKLADTES